MERTLHFTLGDNFGLLLMNIAYEHLIYDLDPNKAIEAITKSLIDIPSNMVRDIFYDKKVIEVSDDGLSVNLVDRDEEKHKDFPKMNLTCFLDEKQKWIVDKGNEIYMLQLSVMRYIDRWHGEYNANIDVEDIISVFFNKMDVSISEILNDNQDINNLIFSLKLSKEYIERVQKVQNVFDFIKRYWFDPLVDYKEQHHIISLVSNNLKLIINRDYAGIKALIDSHDAPLKKVVDAELEIAKCFKEKDYIEPVDIEDGYDAGWLAPNGDFFGFNGEIANMLHEKLANAIRERMKILDGKDPLTDNNCNMDGYLSKNGWAKIHGNHILYDGYLQSKYGMPLVPITDEQINKIVRYGDMCHMGKLFFGSCRKFCSAARFSMTEKPMISKLFDLE